jgi:putative effector of murein hydrolase
MAGHPDRIHITGMLGGSSSRTAIILVGGGIIGKSDGGVILPFMILNMAIAKIEIGGGYVKSAGTIGELRCVERASLIF